MPSVIFLQPDGETHSVSAAPGRSVMLAATMNDVPGIEADCGGSLTCGTCHVYVEPPWDAELPDPDDNERALLEGVAAERRETSRLSCQLKLTADLDGLTVRVPDRQF